MTFAEGAPTAPAARGWPLPVVRDADPDDTGPVLAVYSTCIAADPGYLPFLAPGDEPSVLAWFRLKPLLACLVAELGGTVAGVAGLRDAKPGPGAGQPGGRLLAAVRGLSDRGAHLEAFYGCLYYAALRPSEAIMLREADLYLPAKGWGGSCWPPPPPGPGRPGPTTAPPARNAA